MLIMITTNIIDCSIRVTDLHVQICKMPTATLTVFNLLGCTDVSQQGRYMHVLLEYDDQFGIISMLVAMLT